MIVTIEHDGDTWEIVNFGATRIERSIGQTFCHLASTTRGRQQKNGWCPAQINDWIDWTVIQSALIQRDERQRKDNITAYYDDRRKSGQSALEARP